MKRNQFLAALGAIVAAPFVGKAKEVSRADKYREFIKLGLMSPARAQDYERATFTNLQEQQEKFLEELRRVYMPGDFTIKGSDIHAIIKNTRQ